MTQGIFINGSRPKTKKELKERIQGINNHNKICSCVATGPEEHQRSGPNRDPDCFWHGDEVPPGGHPDYDPYSVVIEATSVFGNEFDGSLAKAMDCHGPCPITNQEKRPFLPQHSHHHYGPFTLVGPDPRTSRKWYATLEYNRDKTRWVLK